MRLAPVLLLALVPLLWACPGGDEQDDSEATEGEGTTAAEVSPQYGSCSSNENCEDPTPFCFAPLGVCMTACAVAETCPQGPPEAETTPVCALSEVDQQPYQVCLLSCTSAEQCPAGQTCAAFPECQDCPGPVCQPQ